MKYISFIFFLFFVSLIHAKVCTEITKTKNTLCSFHSRLLQSSEQIGIQVGVIVTSGNYHFHPKARNIETGEIIVLDPPLKTQYYICDLTQEDGSELWNVEALLLDLFGNDIKFNTFDNKYKILNSDNDNFIIEKSSYLEALQGKKNDWGFRIHKGVNQSVGQTINGLKVSQTEQEKFLNDHPEWRIPLVYDGDDPLKIEVEFGGQLMPSYAQHFYSSLKFGDSKHNTVNDGNILGLAYCPHQIDGGSSKESFIFKPEDCIHLYSTKKAADC